MYHPGERIWSGSMTRRDFLWLAGISTTGMLAGCAVNPVSGEHELMFFTEEGEISLDRKHSPHQFSADYGQVQDKHLNAYLQNLGSRLARVSHRPHMPYSFRCVNAGYVNAYAFPGGSIAVTRGILLELDNEAQLCALLGHEIAHVSARHTASNMSVSMVSRLALAGAAWFVEQKSDEYAPVAAGLGTIAMGALLAFYSRSDERQADSLGMRYMTQAGWNPQGMVGLMDMLREMSEKKPSALEMMFATHPMGQERYMTAVEKLENEYAYAAEYPVNREQFMDSTSSLRGIKQAVRNLQNGEEQMHHEQFQKAEEYFSRALEIAPDDYAGLVLMSKCQLALGRPGQARAVAEKASYIYPEEAQAWHMQGMALMDLRQFDAAFHQFDHYEQILPGNSNTIFLKGVCLESMHQPQRAAREYFRFLEIEQNGEKARYARQRLVQWGFIEP